MRDILPFLRDASGRSEHWSSGELTSLLTEIKGIVRMGQIDWEGPGDERWARVMLEDQVLAIVRVDAPLAFVIGDSIQAKDIRDVLYARSLVVVQAGTWNEAEFTVSPSELASVLPDWEYNQMPGTEPFSVADFWYDTV